MGKRISTKDKIIQILKQHGTLTIDGVMNHFTISEPAVRKQLHVLEREGFIEVKQHKKEIGRPYHTYRLTDQSQQHFPNRYKELSLELLHHLEELQGENIVETLLEKQSLTERKRLEGLLKEHTTLGEKVAALGKAQNESGYMVDVSEEKEDYQLNNYHCPFLEVAKDYPIMCQHEKEMYEALFPDQTVKMETLLVSGEKCCQWRIASSQKK